MTWGKKVVEKMMGCGFTRIALEEEGLRVDFRAEAADRVGCAITGLRIEDLRSPELDADGLKAWADRAAGRITYLMERLVVREFDLAGGTVLLRSDQPWRHGQVTDYYEVVLQIHGTATLIRYSFQEGQGRTQVPCNLTLEVFERLVDDLVGTMRA